MLKCVECRGDMPKRGGFAVAVDELHPGRIMAVVPLDNFVTKEYFLPDQLICGKECLVRRFNEAMNSMLGIEPALHEGMRK